jgi:hypothetical protein
MHPEGPRRPKPTSNSNVPLKIGRNGAVVQVKYFESSEDDEEESSEEEASVAQNS